MQRGKEQLYVDVSVYISSTFFECCFLLFLFDYVYARQKSTIPNIVIILFSSIFKIRRSIHFMLVLFYVS